MVSFDPGATFDRIVSIEMFEHMRNYRELLRRISTWLTPGGQLFVHIFSHTRFAYPFETQGPSDWMSEHFFTGGIMPSDGLLFNFQDDLRIAQHWTLDGTHYQNTARAWLANVDRNRGAVLDIFRKTYGANEALRWLVRWRIFFMAVEELWATDGGREWIVSHYLFRPRG
jgi:cyclopropane-fatty-acyl-phospholipid synthase